MHYIVYRTTCLINGKVYVGKHRTEDLDDGYFGSGKLLNAAIKKHGIENFKREILYSLSTEEEMDAKEAELVTEEFVSRDDNYNLCIGGKGGWSYINTKNLNGTIESRIKGGKVSSAKLTSEERSARRKAAHAAGKYSHLKEMLKTTFSGRKHSEETLSKMRASHANRVSKPNGSYWVTNGSINKKLKPLESIPEGWKRGRTV